MKKVILIKYGELTTKKDNRNFFIKTLKKNIFKKLSSFSFDIIDDYYRMFINKWFVYPLIKNEGGFFLFIFFHLRFFFFFLSKDLYSIVYYVYIRVIT